MVYFEPDGGLNPGSSYTAALSYCGGNPSISFTTSALGEEIADTSSWWTRATSSTSPTPNIRFLKPEGVAELLLSQLENSILMGVVSVDSTSR